MAALISLVCHIVPRVVLSLRDLHNAADYELYFALALLLLSSLIAVNLLSSIRFNLPVLLLPVLRTIIMSLLAPGTIKQYITLNPILYPNIVT